MEFLNDDSPPTRVAFASTAMKFADLQRNNRMVELTGFVSHNRRCVFCVTPER